MNSATIETMETAVDKVSKPVDPKQNKGGKVVTKAIHKMVPTNGHKQVHMKQAEELAGVLKALTWVLSNETTRDTLLTVDEKAGAERVRQRIEARL